MSHNPTFCGFETLEAALSHQKSEGGWVFEATSGEVVWFHYRFTPTKILNHHAVTGLSGRLV
jgi:hypothetical protein